MSIRHTVMTCCLILGLVSVRSEVFQWDGSQAYLDSRPNVSYSFAPQTGVHQLTVKSYAQDGECNLCVSASLYFGTSPGDPVPGRGAFAEPHSSYRLSFEYQGDAPRFWVGVLEFDGLSFWSDRKRLKGLCLTPAPGEWRRSTCVVRTGSGCQRIGFYVNLYVNEKDDLFDLKPGHLLRIRKPLLEKVDIP